MGGALVGEAVGPVRVGRTGVTVGGGPPGVGFGVGVVVGSSSPESAVGVGVAVPPPGCPGGRGRGVPGVPTGERPPGRTVGEPPTRLGVRAIAVWVAGLAVTAGVGVWIGLGASVGSAGATYTGARY